VTWLTPLAGLLLAAAVIPPLILLYFLKLRRRPLSIASTILWKKSVEDLHANAPFQRLRRNILLLLQLLALILLALALAQPRLHAGTLRGGKKVIFIDNSASMTATDTEDGQSRLHHAKRLAKDRIEQIYGSGVLWGAPGETMVIAFSDRSEIMTRFTTNKQQLLAAVERIEPTHGGTNIEDALKLARAFTTNVNPEQAGRVQREPAALHLYSDGRINDLDDQVLEAGEQLTYVPIGTPMADNVAVSMISVDRPYDEPQSVQVFAGVLNFNPDPVTCDVQLSVDDTARGIEEMTIPGAERDADTGALRPGRNNVVFSPFSQPQGAVIEIANLRVDDLAADNTAQIVVPPPKQLVVALVQPKNFLLQSVLEGMPLQSLDILDAEQFNALAQDNQLDQYDVIVLDDYAPQSLLPGRYFSVGATPAIEGLNVYGDGGQQLILNWQRDHPIFEFVNLDNLYVEKMTLIEPGEEIDVLAEAIDAPAVLGVRRGALQVIHLPFHPVDTNWPFLRSYVTFIYNVVEYLGSIGQGLTTRSYAPGEAIKTRLPADAEDIVMRLPNGDVDTVRTPDPTQFAYGPLRLSGVHLLTWQRAGEEGQQSRPFAVNLFSETEGRVQAEQQITIGQESVEGQLGSQAAYTSLWPWAIGVCLVVMMLEWWVYHRKAFF